MTKNYMRATLIAVTAVVLSVVGGAGGMLLVSNVHKDPAPKAQPLVAAQTDTTQNSGTSNFQLKPTYDEGYPESFKAGFMQSCMVSGNNSTESCGCALEYLMSEYSFPHAINIAMNGVPQSLIDGWNNVCYLPDAGYGADSLPQETAQLQLQ